MRKFLSVFMVLVLVLVFGLLVSCEEEEEEEQAIVQPETTRALSFEATTDFPEVYFIGTSWFVIIKSEEKFTLTEWNVLCDKVVGMIMRAYNTGNDIENKRKLMDYFQESKYTWSKIILVKSADEDGVETVSGNIIIKISAIETFNFFDLW